MIPAMPPKTGADFNGGLLAAQIWMFVGKDEPCSRKEVLLPLNLPHGNGNLVHLESSIEAESTPSETYIQRTVDLTILHQVPSCKAIVAVATLDILGNV